jgi:hypothetical protein
VVLAEQRRRSGCGGWTGLIDDDLAYVAAWGFDPAQVIAPILLVHGGRDGVVPSSHSAWLAGRCPSAQQLWLWPEDGHISILTSSAAAALQWLRERAEGGSEPHVGSRAEARSEAAILQGGCAQQRQRPRRLRNQSLLS